MDALTKAIEIFKTQAALAAALDVEPMTVSQWKRRGVPIEQCPAIEKVTDQAVTCEQLRPDVQWVRIAGRVDHYRVSVAA